MQTLLSPPGLSSRSRPLGNSKMRMARGDARSTEQGTSPTLKELGLCKISAARPTGGPGGETFSTVLLIVTFCSSAVCTIRETTSPQRMTVIKGAPQRKPGFPTKTLMCHPIWNFSNEDLNKAFDIRSQGGSFNLPAFNILVRLACLRHGRVRTKSCW